MRTLSNESLFPNPSFEGCKTVRGSYPAETSGGKNWRTLAEKRKNRVVQSSIVSDGRWWRGRSPGGTEEEGRKGEGFQELTGQRTSTHAVHSPLDKREYVWLRGGRRTRRKYPWPDTGKVTRFLHSILKQKIKSLSIRKKGNGYFFSSLSNRRPSSTQI